MVLVTYSDSDTESESEHSTAHEKSIEETPSPSVLVSCPRNHIHKRKADDLLDASDTPRPLPPPLPRSVHSLYATNVRTGTIDDPSLHGGRKRQVVHVQGNWPSHIYLEWYPSKSQLNQLDIVIANAQAIVSRSDTNKQHDPSHSTDSLEANLFKLHSFLHSSLSAQLPLHVSLSAPLTLRTSNKDLFYAELSEAINTAHIGPIDVQLTNLDIVPNFEQSRYFLVARLDPQSRGKLNKLLKICNEICERFGLSRLYQGQNRDGEGSNEAVGVHMKPGTTNRQDIDADTDEDVNDLTAEMKDRQNVFHVSIAWMLAGVTDTVRRQIQQATLQGVEEDIISFRQIKIKIGNIIDDVSL